MAGRKRPEECVYNRKVKAYKTLPAKQGYYKVCYKRSNMITDCLFIDDEISREIWKSQIEWWLEDIPEPFALTKKDAWDKFRIDDDFLKIIIESNFVGAGKKNRVATPQEIETLKIHIQNLMLIKG